MTKERIVVSLLLYSHEPITLLIHSSSSRGRSLFEVVSPEAPPSPPAKEGEKQRMQRVRIQISRGMSEMNRASCVPFPSYKYKQRCYVRYAL